MCSPGITQETMKYNILQTKQNDKKAEFALFCFVLLQAF